MESDEITACSEKKCWCLASCVLHDTDANLFHEFPTIECVETVVLSSVRESHWTGTSYK